MRIAFISDIHYGRLATSREFAIEGEDLALGEVHNAKPLLQGAIDILKEEKPDYLLIAGDLTSTGSPLEFEHCYQVIENIGKAIGIDSSKILFCMGNHDVDWRITKILDAYPNEYKSDDAQLLKQFYQKCAYNVSDDILSCSVSKELRPSYTVRWLSPFTGIAEYDDCIVFVLNSGYMSSHDQELKHGVLSSQQLSWFSDLAEKFKRSDKLKMVLLHHHPLIYPNILPGLDPSTLEEGGELSEICGNTGIALVLHGHKHQPQAKTHYIEGWLNPVTYICAGSLAVNASLRYQVIPNTLHLIDYQSHQQIKLKNFSYTPVDGWTPTKYSSATPVDEIMHLGQHVDIDSVKEKIRNLPYNESIAYESLDIELKNINIETLTKLIKEITGHEIFSNEYGKVSKSFLIYDKGAAVT